MAGVGAGAVAEHFGIDRRAACLGVFQFFEDEHAGPFAEHEAVAVAVERPAGLLRIVVALGEGPHAGKAAEAHRRDRGFAAAGDHHVGIVVLNRLEGVADGVGGAGAGRGHGIVRSAQAELDRDVARWRR